jgi:hypothetical protein
MNSKKIAISQPWASRTLNQNLNKDMWIRSCLNGIFLKYNIITSQLFIHTYPKKISLYFLVFIPKNKNPNATTPLLLPKIIKLIKSILTLKFNKNVHISFKVVPTLFHDAHILAKWLKLEKNPVRLKYALKKLLQQAKLNDSTTNKIKRRR